MNKTFQVIILFFVLIALFFQACKDKRKLDVDVSEIDINIQIKRYGKSLFEINIENLQSELKKRQKEYNFFLGANLDDTTNIIKIRDYLTDPVLINISKETFRQYPDLNYLDKQLTTAYKHIKYYYPENNIPIVFSYISGLDYEYPIKFLDNVVVIALDMYLGADYKPYIKIGLPSYKTKWMRRELIVVDCMKEIALQKNNLGDDNKTLLDKMITQGKILYFIDAMMPDEPDTLKIKYSEKQLEWCEKNESNIWSYFIENKLLYSTNNAVINKFIVEGPFTSIFSKESPARTSDFIGWEIVKKYMNNNKEITFEELMDETDSQKILSKSRYKPKK